jgi:molybdopterin/thiamine biosynthesis adenylyltransferase
LNISAPKVPNNLLLARRALEGHDGIAVINDWAYYASISEWVLKCQLSLKLPENSLIPEKTDWFIHVSTWYPSGNISFFPAKDGGISMTYPHQADNRFDIELPWRTGNICLSEDIHILGRHQEAKEPLEVESRLLWHFKRALSWLQTAAEGNLFKPGDPFELPDFSPKNDYIFPFSEDSKSYAFWQKSHENVGTVDLIPFNTKIFCMTRFYDTFGKQILKIEWGENIRKYQESPLKGLWIKLNQIPVIEPWQAPRTIADLCEIMNLQGLDFYTILGKVTSKIRDGKRHPLFLGFPIPEFYGGEPSGIHWQAFLLPALSRGSNFKNGFRPNEKGFMSRDKQVVLKPSENLDWKVTQNWCEEQISSRGRLPDFMSTRKILIIGAGALGSALSELLVRGNTKQLVIIDGDILKVGNLVRHTLMVDGVEKGKSLMLAERLNLLSPHVSISHIQNYFPPSDDNEIEKCRNCDVVIDCTGSDVILDALQSFSWGTKKYFFSFSFSYAAQQLFCFFSYGDNFPVELFKEMIRPALTSDTYKDKLSNLPREGIGCWHPVFPARSDDIWLLAATAVKHMENVLRDREKYNTPSLIIYNQISESDSFTGITRIGYEHSERNENE